MNTLRTVLLQSALDWHDPAANRARFDALIAETAPCDLLVLPEMFATGFTMSPELVAESMDGPSVSWMQGVAREREAAVCGSLAMRDGNGYVNRFVFAHPDGHLDTYDKRHLFALAGEHRAYQSGDQRSVFHFRGWRIAPQVCYDLRFPVWHRHAEGCDLMIFVANWPAPRINAWRVLLQARAIENQCFVVGVNRVGRDENDRRYPGASVAHGPDGEALLAAGDTTGALPVVLDRAVMTAFRERLPFYKDADRFEIDT
ncbi:MAG: amidohydrolase [Pseudomonadota bacterium]